jgi:S1-C subfamily serine protease
MSTASTDVTTGLRAAAVGAAEAAAPTVVRIGQHGGRGCGVVLGAGHVLTNAHNLRDRTTEVSFPDGRRAQGEVTAVDADGDLAVLAVDTGAVAPITWAEALPDPGSIVFAVSRARDGGVRLSFGMVSGVERAFRGPRGRQVSGSVEHTAPLARGSSGSPLVDEAGRLVALNTARLGDGFYLALPADADLRARVDALVAGEAPRHLVLGVGLASTEVAAKLRASVGLPDRPGLLVRTLADGGAAQRAGILVGDLLVAAGDEVLATVDDLHRALDAARDSGELVLKVVRGTDELTVTASF